ncbi:hypothetical protein MNBD_DELTA01-63 [hydrothermal vent metagenome]|uniref:DUF4935 domain-containing protein n=1 Tax=hydrothermal vent metagenome TaxID=652676 RepID=A0A3B0QKJ3_9ZZZZ
MNTQQIKINIIFDTSILFTNDTYQLISHNLKKLIEDFTEKDDLEITWHLPEVVKKERQYQIEENVKKKRKEFISAQKGLTPFLESSTQIKEDSIQKTIEELIEADIKKYEIQISLLDCNVVDWNKLISNSCDRLSPFEEVEKGEKGFRDALILETMYQFAQGLEKHSESMTLCVVRDKRLCKALLTRTDSISNIKIFEDLLKCRSFMNIQLASQNEEAMEIILKKAKTFFYKPEDSKSFYYHEKIGQMILTELSDFLTRMHGDDFKRDKFFWDIKDPIFEDFENNRIHFASKVHVHSEVFRHGYGVTFGESVGDTYSLGEFYLHQNNYDVISERNGEIIACKKRDIIHYVDIFEVCWSAKVGEDNKLKDAVMEIFTIDETNQENFSYQL